MFRDANRGTIAVFLLFVILIGLMILVLIADAPLPQNGTIVEITPQSTLAQ